MNMEAEEVRRRMPAIIAQEVAAINKTFQGRTLDAGTRPAWTVVAGRSYIAYGLKLGGAVLPQDVEKLLPKLTEALSALRHRPTDVRLRRKPLALEVSHPFPAPLDWQRAQTALQPDTMLTGRNYSGGEPTDDTLCFDDTPHVLIAGTTGSGKSTLLRMMVATLALNTSPDALRLHLVDLKNTDLKPFKRLPHKELFAGEENEAQQVIRLVHREVRRRKDTEDTHAPRIVLVIDELAEVGDRDTLDLLSSILRVGRSFRVNVIAATQLPTKATCGEKNNYTVRFVGAITDAQSAVTAAGRGQTGAELLSGKGAFLRVEGNRLDRLQAYWLDDDGTAQMVDAAVQRWGRHERVPVYQNDTDAISAPYWPVPQRDISGGTSGTRAVQPVEVVRSVPATRAARWPIPERPLTAAEVAAVRQMHANGASKNRILDVVYGGKTPKRFAWVSEALNEGGAV